MILLDFSQVMIGSFMAMGRGSVVVEEDLLRHTVLNTVRMYKNQFKEAYDAGGMVICCDSSHNWRKESFPEYNANRKTKRETDTTDWKSLFEFLHEMIDDFRSYFPYKVMKIDKAEADDIIGVLTKECQETPTVIISSDKDFMQLISENILMLNHRNELIGIPEVYEKFGFSILSKKHNYLYI